MNRCKELHNISECYRLVHESMHVHKGDTYTCADLFKGSDAAKHHFYYVKAGYDVNKYQALFKKYKKQCEPEFFEVHGFMNLTNAKMEYHFNYLFRIQCTQHMATTVFAGFSYDYGIDRVNYNKREIFVPENNDEALQDAMQCDFFLPGMFMKPATREHLGDIMSALN